MSRTVTSPGGDEVVVLDDEDFAELLELDWPSQSFTTAIRPTPVRIAALGALWYSGPVEDRSGRASARLQELAIALDPAGMAAGMAAGRTMVNALRAPPVRLCWEAEIRGKRTFSIRLIGLPERWLGPIQALAATAGKDPTEREPGAEPIEGRGPRTSTGSAPLPDGLVEGVATALLARVVEALSGTPGSPEAVAEAAALRGDLRAATEALAASQERLGAVTEYGRRLKRERDEARDRLGAVTKERDGLRQRLRVSEANLRAAMSPETRSLIDGEVRKEVAKVMRQAPTARSVYDLEEG